MKIKTLLVIILKKSILTFKFLWVTWWAWLVILIGVFAVYRYFATNESRYLFGILITTMGAWYVFYEWREYLKKHKNIE